MRKSIIQEKSFQFALSTVKLCKELQKDKEYIMSKQVIRSGTSVGANIREAKMLLQKKTSFTNYQLLKKNVMNQYTGLKFYMLLTILKKTNM